MQKVKLAIQTILVFQFIFGALPGYANGMVAGAVSYRQKTVGVQIDGKLIESFELDHGPMLQETKQAYDEFNKLSKQEQFEEYNRILKLMEDQKHRQAKEYSKLKNVIKRQVGQTIIKFPKEMMVFAISMGAIVAFKLFTNYAHNPVGMIQHLEHQMSPIGAMSFFFFMASQGITAEYLMFLLKSPGASVYINYFAMTVGFMVQSLSAELMADPNVKSCVGSLMTAWNFKKEELSACQQVYATYGTIEKLNQYGPSLASMLISTAMIGYGQNKLSKGLAIAAFEVTVRGYEKMGAKLMKSSMFFIPGKLQFTGFKALLVHGFNITLFVGIDQLIHNTVADIYDNLVQGSWIMSSRQEDITKFLYKNDLAKWQKDLSEEDVELLETTNRHISNWKMANLRLTMEANANWKSMLDQLNNMYYATHEFYPMIINSAASYKYDFFERQSLHKNYPLWGVQPYEVDLSKEIEKLKQSQNQAPESAEAAGLEAMMASVDSTGQNQRQEKNPYTQIHDEQIRIAPMTENQQSVELQDYSAKLIEKYQFDPDLKKKWQLEKPKNEWRAFRPYNLNINLSDYNHLRQIVIRLNSQDRNIQGQALEKINLIIEQNLESLGQFAKLMNFKDYSFEERCKKVFSKLKATGVDLEKEFGVYLAEIIKLKMRFGDFKPYFHRGEGFVRSLEKAEALKNALSKVKHPSQSGNVITTSIGDYLVAQMLCGPTVFQGVISTTRGFPAIFNPPRITNVQSDEVCKKIVAATHTSLFAPVHGGFKDNQGRTYESIWKMIIENIDPNIMGRQLNDESQFTNFWDKYVTGQMKTSYHFFQEQYKQIIFDLINKLRPQQGSSLNQGPVANGVILANFQQLQMNLIIFGKILANTYVNKMNKNLPKELLATNVADFRVTENTASLEALKKRQKMIFNSQEVVMQAFDQLVKRVNEIQLAKDKKTGKWIAFQLPELSQLKHSVQEFDSAVKNLSGLVQKLNLIDEKGNSRLTQNQLKILEVLKNQMTGIGQEMNLYIELANTVDWKSQTENPMSDEEKDKMEKMIEEKKKQIQSVGPMRY